MFRSAICQVVLQLCWWRVNFDPGTGAMLASLVSSFYFYPALQSHKHSQHTSHACECIAHMRGCTDSPVNVCLSSGLAWPLVLLSLAATVCWATLPSLAA